MTARQEEGAAEGGRPHATLEPPPVLLPIPGTQRRRRLWFRIDWELVACGLHGHELVATDAEAVEAEHSTFARESEGLRWYRCLRCEAWVPLAPPGAAAAGAAPSVADLTIPIRGKRLRDRYVLRIIVLDRAVRALLAGSVAAAIILFAQHKSGLHHTYLRFLSAFQVDVGGPGGGKGGIFQDINDVFKLSTATIYLIGVAVATYTALMVVEAVGLWRARRWAEYVTLLETSVFVPLEVYELVGSVTVFKVAALILNLAIILYLLIAHRLFGIRGGRRAAVAAYGEEG